MVSGIFVEGRTQTIPFILASDCKNKEDQKNLTSKTCQLFPKTGRSKATNLMKHRNK